MCSRPPTDSPHNWASRPCGFSFQSKNGTGPPRILRLDQSNTLVTTSHVTLTYINNVIIFVIDLGLYNILIVIVTVHCYSKSIVQMRVSVTVGGSGKNCCEQPTNTTTMKGAVDYGTSSRDVADYPATVCWLLGTDDADAGQHHWPRRGWT